MHPAPFEQPNSSFGVPYPPGSSRTTQHFFDESQADPHGYQVPQYSSRAITPDNEAAHPFFSTEGREATQTFTEKCRDIGLNKLLRDLDWEVDEEKTLGVRSIKERSRLTANFMHELCGGNEAVMAQVLVKFLSHHEAVRDSVCESTSDSRQSSVRDHACNNLCAFNKHLSGLKGCTTEESAAKTTIASAVTFPSGAAQQSVMKPSLNELSQATGLSRQTLKKGQIQNELMLFSGGRGRYERPTRKTRSDCVLPLLTKLVQEKFCHNDRYTRVDSFSKARKVKVPVVEQEEGGGWKITGYRTESHEPRMWLTSSTTGLYKMFIESEEWAAFQAENPGVTMGRSTFAKTLCSCCSKPKPESCVNIIISQQRHYMRAIDKVLRNDKVLKAAIEKCDCPLHRSRRDGGDAQSFLWTEHLNEDPKSFVQRGGCGRTQHPHLQAPSDPTAPKLMPWDCGHSSCDRCGVARKFQILKCPGTSRKRMLSLWNVVC
jgi:hypothetical protein